MVETILTVVRRRETVGTRFLMRFGRASGDAGTDGRTFDRWRRWGFLADTATAAGEGVRCIGAGPCSLNFSRGGAIFRILAD